MLLIYLKYAIFILSQGMFFASMGRGNKAILAFTGFLALTSTAFLISGDLYNRFLNVIGVEQTADSAACAVQNIDWEQAKGENTCRAMRVYIRRHGESSCIAVTYAKTRRRELCRPEAAEMEIDANIAVRRLD